MDLFLLICFIFSALFFKEMHIFADYLYTVKLFHKSFLVRFFTKSVIIVVAWLPLMISLNARVDFEVKKSLAKQEQIKIEAPVEEKTAEQKEIDDSMQILLMTLAAG